MPDEPQLTQDQETPHRLPSLTRVHGHSNDFRPSPSAASSHYIDRSTDPDMLDTKTYTRLLTPGDVDGCVVVENAAFPESQRATREKFEYRLARCEGICFGTFTTANPEDFSPPETEGSSDRQPTLLAHIVSTRTKNVHITDDDMKVPPNWRTDDSAKSPLGHQDEGRTVAIHSLAVLPAYQSKGVGKHLLKAYIEHIESSGVADRISLITYDRLVGYYERFGFKNDGPSNVAFGGESWYDMVLTFDESKTANKSTK